MDNRRNIVAKLMDMIRDNKLPTSFKVDNVDSDHKLISKMLDRRGVKYDIGIAKDKDKSSLWFYRRK